MDGIKGAQDVWWRLKSPSRAWVVTGNQWEKEIERDAVGL